MKSLRWQLALKLLAFNIFCLVYVPIAFVISWLLRTLLSAKQTAAELFQAYKSGTSVIKTSDATIRLYESINSK